jgi:carbonic anhydrase
MSRVPELLKVNLGADGHAVRARDNPGTTERRLNTQHYTLNDRHFTSKPKKSLAVPGEAGRFVRPIR